MGLRETLNKNQTAVMIGAGVIVVLALGAAFFLSGGGGPKVQTGNPKAFYTIDDGKTYFVDDDVPYKVAPFPKDGKNAYRCEVWTCDGGATKKVIFLQRWTPAAQKRLADALAKNELEDSQVMQIESGLGSEVCLAGQGSDPTHWVPYTDPRAQRIMASPCPPGSKADRIVPE